MRTPRPLPPPLDEMMGFRVLEKEEENPRFGFRDLDWVKGLEEEIGVEKVVEKEVAAAIVNFLLLPTQFHSF